MAIVERYGGPEEINRKASEARQLDNLMARLRDESSPYLADVEWLIEQRDEGAFVSMEEYRRKVLGSKADSQEINQANAVTLEISALQYFPWLVVEGRRAIEKLNDGGVRAYRASGAKVEDIVSHYRAGDLEEITTENACGHHGCHH